MQTNYVQTFSQLQSNVSHDQRSKAKRSKTNQLGCARRPVQATVINL